MSCIRLWYVCILYLYGVMIFFESYNLRSLRSPFSWSRLYLHSSRHSQFSIILKIQCKSQNLFLRKNNITVDYHLQAKNDTSSFQKGLLLWRSHQKHPTWRMIRWLLEWLLLFPVVSHHLKHYYTFRQEENIKPIKLPIWWLSDTVWHTVCYARGRSRERKKANWLQY